MFKLNGLYNTATLTMTLFHSKGMVWDMLDYTGYKVGHLAKDINEYNHKKWRKRNDLKQWINSNFNRKQKQG